MTIGKVESYVIVGIADLKLAKSPQMIRTSALGSCVGVIVYDLSKEIAGLTHIMLPDSNLSKQEKINPYKYADTAIHCLLTKLNAKGANKFQLKAKIAGGAQMRSEEHTSELQSRGHLVCRLLLANKNYKGTTPPRHL